MTNLKFRAAILVCKFAFIEGSCTYSHSYCPEAPNARVKYVAHRASCYSYRAKWSIWDELDIKALNEKIARKNLAMLCQ